MRKITIRTEIRNRKSSNKGNELKKKDVNKKL